MMLTTLRDGLPALGLDLSDEVQKTLCRFGQAVVEQNQVMNLTAITEPEQVAKLEGRSGGTYTGPQDGPQDGEWGDGIGKGHMQVLEKDIRNLALRNQWDILERLVRAKTDSGQLSEQESIQLTQILEDVGYSGG